MARTQALTVLLALLAADPGEVILDSIYGSGVANRVLMDLVDSPHTTLLQVRFFALHTPDCPFIVSVSVLSGSPDQDAVCPTRKD